MSEPVRDELSDLVMLLRSATPREETLATARAGVLRRAPYAPGMLSGIGSRGIASRIVLATLVVLVGSAPQAPHIVSYSKHAPAFVAPLPDPQPMPIEPAPSVAIEIETPRAPRRHRRAPVAARTGPSRELTRARSEYAAGRCANAAAGFARVADGTTGDGASDHAQAQFFLAKCLYQLGLYHASAAEFDAIARAGEEHPFFRASLPSLAMLADRVPEDSVILTSIAHYRPEQIEQLDAPAARDVHAHLAYLLGRARYETGNDVDAVALLSRVPDGTRWALPARFYEGVSHVRLHRAQPALVAFRRVIEAVDTNRTGGRRDGVHLRELAWMSIARLSYSLAMERRGDGRASELLTRAVDAWRHIPPHSEYWVDAFFEETWALYMARDYAHALGHVHALDSPYLRERADPEAGAIRAMIFYEHCQWDATDEALSRFHRRYDPILRSVRSTERLVSSNENAFRMMLALRAGRSRVPLRARGIVRAALSDRELERYVEDVSAIGREQHRLASLGGPIAESDRIASMLALAQSMAIDRAGQLATERVHRLNNELSERITRMDTIEVELARQRRLELTRPNHNPMAPRDGGQVWAVQGGERWPFNGEWWPDEIPYFVQDVRNRCGR
jgi:hypothetical protein